MSTGAPRPLPAGGARRVTIGDLARELRLSQSSVSAALNDNPGVSEQTRQRVKALADELGWRPHAGARALRLQRRRTVGLVLARDPQQLANEPFYSFVIAGIEELLQQEDYSLMLRMVGSHADDLAIYRKWHEEQSVDGLFVFDVMADDPRVALLTQLRMPMVLVGAVEHQEGVLHLDTDATVEAGLLLDHLAGLGHRRIGHVTGPPSLRHEQLRLAALRARAAHLGVELVSLPGDYTLDGAASAAQTLLNLSTRPTAIIGSSDLTALGVLRTARSRGMVVPDDLSVVGWDDSLTGQVLVPGITALDRDPMGMGRSAAAMLVDALEGRPAGTAGMGGPRPRLVVRGSTAAPRLVTVA